MVRSLTVVNTLLYKLLSVSYLSRYNSVPLSCQCLKPVTILSTISWAIDVTLTLIRIISITNQWARSQLICFNENQITLSINQIGVSITTNVFEVYILQVKAMLRIYNTVKIGAIKMYVIIYIYHMIKLIMLRIHLKCSTNE